MWRVAVVLLIPFLLAPSPPRRRAPSPPAGSPWASVGSILTANDGTAGTTWGPTTSAVLEVGNVAVCVVGKDETGSGTTDGDNAQFTSVTDAASNTWVEVIEFCNMQNSTAANGACVAIYRTKATTELGSGAAITFTFSASTTRKAASCWEFTGGTVSAAAGANGLANDAADPGAMTDATTVSREHLFVRASACESNSTAYTADADYSTFTHTASTSDSGTSATSIGARGEFRIASEATSASSDPSYVSADCASAIGGLNSDP